MKKTKLGEFEELVLLTVAALQQDAYGVENRMRLISLRMLKHRIQGKTT